MNTDHNAQAQVVPGSQGLYPAGQVGTPYPIASDPVQSVEGQPAYAPSNLQLADIYKDPTVLAFLRTSGLSEQVAANDIARRQQAIGQTLNTNLDDLNASGEIQRRNVAGSAESRGVFKSGEMLRNVAEQEAQQARQQSALQNNAMNQVNDLHGQLANQVAQNQQRATEAGLQSYMTNTLAAGKADINSQYNNHDYGSGYDDGSAANNGY